MTTKLKGEEVKLLGNEPKVGALAPEVKLIDKNLAEVSVGGKKDKVQLIVTVPSLDTAVCATETRNFNVKAAGLDGVETTIVSVDLPFAQKRFCSTDGIDNLVVASDFRSKQFANAYGVLIGSGVLSGLLARAVFVVDKEGKISYVQMVAEIADEPNYDEALEAARAACD